LPIPSVNANPPAPPANANIIGLAYNFGPAGATFNPPITLTWTYDPATLPAGVAEQNLVIAYYDAASGKWVELPGTVNTTTHTVTAQVSHFSTYAIIGKYAPAAFTISSLNISPIEVAPNDKVTIGVSVTNTGGIKGDYTVVLNINGVKEAENSVTVAAGSSQTVTFSVAKDKAGSYSVAVGGQSGSFTVKAPPSPTPTATTPAAITPAPAPTAITPAPAPPETTAPVPPPVKATVTNWLKIGGIIGAVIVAGLLLFFLIRTFIWRRQGG
jgi:hypothetical protein